MSITIPLQHDFSYSEYIEMLILIILTVGPIIPSYSIAIMSVYIAYLLFRYRQIRTIKISRFHFLICTTIIIAMIVDIRNVSNYNPYSLVGFGTLVSFLAAPFLVRRFELDHFLKLLETVAFFLCVCSIIGMLLVSFFPDLVRKFPTIHFYHNTLYTVGVFNTMSDWSGLGLHSRNFGVGSEPGRFQFIINLGFCVFLKIREKNIRFYIKRGAVYIAAMLWTYSTTGYIVMGVLLLSTAIKSGKKLFIIALIVVILLALFYSLFLYQRDKILTGVGSIESRFSRSLYVIKNYWSCFFGLGSTGYNAVYSDNIEIGSWDMYTNLFLRYGYPFIILFLIMILSIWKLDFQLFAVIFLALFTENILGPVTLMICYYAMGKKESKMKKSLLS